MAVCLVRGCLTCTSAAATTCSACRTGFTLDGTGLCTKDCPEGQFDVVVALDDVGCQACNNSINFCQACTYEFPIVVCTKCLVGYFLNGFRCTACLSPIPNCLSCTSAASCDVCASGLKPVDGGCFAPSCTVAGCFVCSTLNAKVCN